MLKILLRALSCDSGIMLSARLNGGKIERQRGAYRHAVSMEQIDTAIPEYLPLQSRATRISFPLAGVAGAVGDGCRSLIRSSGGTMPVTGLPACAPAPLRLEC